jgi:hypothetical protein
MSIAARVVATGEFFHATGVIDEHGIQHDAYGRLEPKKRYLGSLFPGTQVADTIKFSEVTFLEFSGSELEEVDVTGTIRMLPVRLPR